MATLSHAESRRLYSWWWDSHISPKNSKWLQENLTDMDMKVKAMIKLIEEDADSFRRRAEMYYRKRPELMKLVEEFYRAYRALAERYDQATGALRQAHRTMAEAFPNQIPFVVSDESPSGSSSIDVEPHTPEMLPPVRALFDFDKSQKDASSMSSPAYALKRNGAFSEQNDAITSKEGLGQLNGMFSTEEEAGHVDFADGSVRKGMDFQEEEGNSFKDKILQEELSQLLKENQNLKNQITSESGRADKAETEVESLKGTLSELKSEKEAALLRYQLSQERISNLEAEIFRTQEDFKKLSDEMLIEITKLKTVDDRCLLLEKENQSLQLELDAFKGTTKKQQEELDMKKEELEKLNISIRDERRQSVQADMTRQSMEKLHSQSQEEVRLLALEIQSGVQKLKSMELGHVGLEEEVRRLKEENCSLNEQSFSSALKITNLLDEISFLKKSKRMLEDEMGLHVEENKVLQQEVCSLKADKEDLEQRHHGLTEQIGAVNLNLESLQALVKELSDGNVELKEICKKHEDEKVLHLENLKQLEKILEKNAVLENSLSDANVQLEGLREKIKTLEESCESVWGKISIHISEKAVLLSHMEAIAQNMEKLSEQNLLLENSLSDVNVEFEGLRGKLKVLEESYQSLYDQKSNLLAEKSILVSQVESISQSLGNLENRYAELEGKNLNLVREKDLIINQVLELQDCLKLEKEEYETLMQSSKSQLATLENRICLLQEEYQLREEEFEVEQHKIVNAQIEIFILKRCLRDMKEKNLILLDKCQQYLETSTFAEKLISELQQESFIQKKKLTSLSELNKKLVEDIHLMMKMLNIRKDYGSPDDQLLELILREIRDLQTSISNAQVDIQHLILEKSVLLTNLEQLGLDVADLKSERNLLERDSKLRFEELSVLQSEKCELLEINEHLRQNVQACNQRENIIKAEMEIVCRQLSDLREAHSTLQSEISKLLEENQSLSKKYYDLREKKDTLEEENSVILAEAMTLDYLYLIFRSYNAERALELQLLSNDLDCLCGLRNDLDQEIRIMNEKVGALEDENMSLKESVVDLEKCRRRLVILEDDVNTARNICEQLNLQIETGQDILVRKDMELLEANQKIEATQDKNTELSRKLEGLMLDIDGAMVVKEESEKKIFTLTVDNAHRDNEIACLHQAYDTSNGELDKLHEVVDGLRKRERHLISETKEGTNEVKSCEIEITRLLKEVQISTINAAVFEEKMLELLITCESLEMSAMVQREMLYKEITLRSLYEDKLKEKLDALEGENKGLKEELSAYLPLVLSLWDDVASLEEHALSLAKHCALSNQEKQDNLLVSLQHKTSNQVQNEDHRATASAGILELQKLHAKVEALEKVVIDTQSRLKQERFVSNASLEAAMREIEGLKSKGSTGQEEAQISKDIVLHLIKNEEPGKLQKGDAEISREKFEQMMKDIQLDHVLTSSQYENGASSHAPSTIEIAETNDQMFELWETVDCNKMEKASPVNSERDLVSHEIKAVEEEKSECYSELVAENELSIDKLELPRKVAESHQWSRSVSERLSSDAQRLSVLQKSAKELKRTMETSEWSNSPTSFEFDTVKAQLKEVEGAILHLIDINSKLTKKAEEFSASSDSLVGKQNDEMGNISERKISERARRGSEKIGRLELDLQKIQYILLKLKEEHDNKKARAAERRTRVLLRDYLYGRRDSPRRKKVHCCACMRPRTKDE